MKSRATRRRALRRKRGGTRRFWGVVTAGAMAAALVTIASWWDLHRNVSLAQGEVLVVVRPGESFAAVAEQLTASGVGWSARSLKLWAQLYGVDRQIRPGEYLLRSPISAWSALEQMRSGLAGYRVLTIPEGSTVADIAALYEAGGFGSGGDFLRATQDPGLQRELVMPETGFEGYLFPDTYHFVWADPPERMIRTMVRRFREQSGSLVADRERLGLSEHEMVTLASIIEKEAKKEEERPVISAVFHNRLRRGMPLQADPTAVYGLGRGVRPEPEHLRTWTPYNTYLQKGLPPGPICNPGVAALEAAVRPAPVDYLYFFARGDGSHVFSRTLDQHEAAIQQLTRPSSASPKGKPTTPSFQAKRSGTWPNVSKTKRRSKRATVSR